MSQLKYVAAIVFGLSCLACGGGAASEAPEDAPTASPAPSAPDRAGRGRRGRRAGGGGGVAPAPAVDSPAYKTFETEGAKDRIVFTSDTKLKKTWRNMTGSAVIGSWTQSGDTVDVSYEPASHHGSTAETFVTRGDCTLIRTVRIDRKTGERVESPTTYTLDEPRCH